MIIDFRPLILSYGRSVGILMKSTFGFSLILLLLILSQYGFANPGYKVISESSQELVIQLVPTEWKTIRFDDGEVICPQGALLENREDGLVTPYYRTLIGLPSAETPKFQITRQSWQIVGGIHPPRGTEEVVNDRLPPLGSVAPVFLGAPFLWRNHWVVDLYVIPLIVADEGVRKLEELELTIRYPAVQPGMRYSHDVLAEKTLLNPRSATRWTLTTVPTLQQGESFPEGLLYRIEIREEGIYKLTKNFLDQQGVDLSGFNPQYFKIFGNGGLVLPEDFSTPRDDQLRENAILVIGEEDENWDDGDYILFYGRSVNSWNANRTIGDYRHTNNPFTTTNVYWLNVSEDNTPGRRMQTLDSELQPTYRTNIARSRTFYENDLIIFYSYDERESGKEWYASELRIGDRTSVNFPASSPLPDESATVWFSAKKSSTYSPLGQVTINNNPNFTETFSLSSVLHAFELPAGILNNGINTLTFSVHPQNNQTSGGGLLDWFEVSYMRELQTNTGKMEFDALPEDGVAEVTIAGIQSPWIFDIEEYDQVRCTRHNPFVVQTRTDSPRRYLALSEDRFLTIINIMEDHVGRGEYPNGLRDVDLQADYIYIVHDDFWDASAALEQHVEQRDNVEVIRVNIRDIYQEFSWGLFDPTAMRDFLYYAQTNWRSEQDGPVRSCLLIGDGDYDYRNLTFSGDKNWIPPYENYRNCRDDFFTEFGTNEASLVMGRLPVQKESELENFITNLIAYDSGVDRGPWQSRIILVADDEFVDIGPTISDQEHLTDSEDIALHSLPSYMDVEKIYIGAYPTSYDPATGIRLKPLATRDLLQALGKGSLLVNYIGHGNAHVWAHEQLFLDTRDRTLVNSGDKNPIYVAATCAWGHFDRPNNEAFFESLLTMYGGAIGVIAASRNTSGSANEQLVENYYLRFFDRDQDYSAGECLWLAKRAAAGSTNPYYHYFGDPMMTPALPKWDVTVTEVNPDSLTALETGQVIAEIRRPQENHPDDMFQGEALVTLIGGYRLLTYTFTEKIDGRYVNGAQTHYRLPLGLLFRGYTSVSNGSLQARFVVPRDVVYGSNTAQVQIYATDEVNDAVGVMSNLAISCQSGDLSDQTPPQIHIYFNHRNWRNGDLTTLQPNLIVDIYDTSGINLTGEIGHELKALIDGGKQEVSLTNDFTYERDRYTSGAAERTLFDLSPGLHHLEIWAWDNANNLGREGVTFETMDTGGQDGDGSGFYMQNVYNAPNPFSDETYFTFEGADVARATVKIFTPSGRQIKTLEARFNDAQSFYYIPWDGRDQYQDDVANGVYLYKLTVESVYGQSSEQYGKVMRLR